MSGSSHLGEGFAEDEQDVVGQPVAGVLEQEPDHPLDRGAQVRQGQRRAQASSGPTASRPVSLKLGPINIPVTAMTASNTRAIMIHTGC